MMKHKTASSRTSSSRSASSRAAPRTKAAKQAKVHKVMKEFKDGALKSGNAGHGGKVKTRAQAVAIAMHESGQSWKRPSAHA